MACDWYRGFSEDKKNEKEIDTGICLKRKIKQKLK